MPQLYYSASLCADKHFATSREWLVTNGIGGYAAGTVADIPTRRYHGLMIAALKAPLGRKLLASKLDAIATYNQKQYILFNEQRDASDRHFAGLSYLQSFRLDAGMPIWTYAFADVLLEKRLWMAEGKHTTYVQYHVLRASSEVALELRLGVNYRIHHDNSEKYDYEIEIQPSESGCDIHFEDQTLHVISSATANTVNKWHSPYYHAIEDFRGFEAHDTNIWAASFKSTLQSKEKTSIILTIENNVVSDVTKALDNYQTHKRTLIEKSPIAGTHPNIDQLILAADQFIVKRQTQTIKDGRTIIAGYPWFADWGRDTMISLTGLTLSTGRSDVARQVLATYAQFVDQGMLPNRFPDDGEAPEYNTADATLWYFQAIWQYYERTKDKEFISTLFAALQSIIEWHEQGTRYGIHVDQSDGLLFAGEAGKQLTWMDVKIDNWVVTPRHGKPIEINALWINALRIMCYFGELFDEDTRAYADRLAQAEKSFQRFWNEHLSYCYDVIDSSNGDDDSLRPNQLIALALPNCPFSTEQQKSIIKICSQRLYTHAGMRTRDPMHKDYTGRYGGDFRKRDSAYHQGTVWGWLIGPFIDAILNVYDDTALATSYLEPILQHIHSRCVGTLSEIYEGNAPFLPRGAFAQAWSVAEVLRVWERLVQT